LLLIVFLFLFLSLQVPLDVVTQRMQIAGKHSAEGKITSVVRNIYQTSGIRGFYRGYFASLLVFVPTSSCWWMTYSNMCAILGKDDRASYVDTMGKTMISGFVAGMTSAVVTNPLDVIKTRLQTSTAKEKKSFFSLAKQLYRQEGLKGFLRGSTARMSAMSPTSVMMILSYETVKRLSLKEPIE
jgi:solute carrier family 25 protein 44